MIIPGQVQRFTATFRTASGVLTDPDALTWRIKDPSGTVDVYVHGTAPESVRSSVGVFTLTITLDAAGEWWPRVEATGAVAAVDELDRPIVVSPSHVL
jgi:hypothetical protein